MRNIVVGIPPTTQTIASGDGYVEFTVTTGPLMYVGLTNGTTTYNGRALPFALSFGGSGASVYESGAWKADASFVTGDVFRIAIEGGVVNYKKNGTVFYTSALPPAYPLRAEAALYNIGATVGGAVILGQ